MALTAIDALSTLAIMGNWTEFERMTYWIADNVRNLASLAAPMSRRPFFHLGFV